MEVLVDTVAMKGERPPISENNDFLPELVAMMKEAWDQV